MLQLKAQKKCNANKNQKDAVVKVQYILISEEVDYQRQTETFYNDKGAVSSTGHENPKYLCT